jgi:uncharacterized protein YjbI with pentapeptide repeats
MFDRVRVWFRHQSGFDTEASTRAKFARIAGNTWWKFRRRTLVRLRSKIRPALLFVTASIAAIALITIIWLAPAIIDMHQLELIPDPKDRATATNDSRSLMLQTVLALGGLFTIIYTARNYFLSKAGQFSDRLITAADHLAAATSIQRVGGIHAVARLMKESSADHQGLVDILSSFVRDAAKLEPDRDLLSDEADDMEDDEAYEYMWSWVPERPAIDVQAALSALAKRPRRPEVSWLPLGGTRLTGLRLNSHSIQSFHFEGSDLRGSDFANARASSFAFLESDVRGSNFSGATLRSGHLAESDFRYSYFRWVDLSGSGFYDSDFRGCLFIDPMVRDCDFHDADFRGVDLSTAIGLTNEQIATAQTDEHTILPKYLTLNEDRGTASDNKASKPSHD